MATDPMNLCMGCMNEKGNSAVCSSCGWVEGSMPDLPQHLPPHTILREKYLLGKVLGYGGFGVTYLAWDMDLNLKVAVKEYLPQNISSRSPGTVQVTAYSGNLGEQYLYGIEKFLEEARTIAQFDGHPNIVSIRDFFRANSTAYYVMSYLEGMTLKQYLAKHSGALSYDLALTFIMPVLDALASVHMVGILHRDISPDNVFITNQGLVKVLDFGAARQAAGGQHSLSVILKPGYAPEEQYRTKGNQGPWTDIYACAALLYRMVTGQLPPESLDRLENDTLLKPSTMGIDIPWEAEAAMMQALSVKAAGRFQSVAAFQKALVGNIPTESQKMMPPSASVTSLSAQPSYQPAQPQPMSQTPVQTACQPQPPQPLVQPDANYTGVSAMPFASNNPQSSYLQPVSHNPAVRSIENPAVQPMQQPKSRSKSPLLWIIPAVSVVGVGVLALMVVLAVNLVGKNLKQTGAYTSNEATPSIVMIASQRPSAKPTIAVTLAATQAATQATKAPATPKPTAAVTAVPTLKPTATLQPTAAPSPNPSGTIKAPGMTTVFSKPRMVKSVDKNNKPGAATTVYSMRRSKFYFYVGLSGTKGTEKYKIRWMLKDNTIISESDFIVDETIISKWASLFMLNDAPWQNAAPSMNISSWVCQIVTLDGTPVLSCNFNVAKDPMAYLPKVNTSSVYYFDGDNTLTETRYYIQVKPGILAVIQIVGQEADVSYIRLAKDGSLQMASDSNIQKWQVYIPAIPIPKATWSYANSSTIKYQFTMQAIKNGLVVNKKTYNNCLTVNAALDVPDGADKFNYTFYLAPGVGELYYKVTEGTYKGTVEYLKSSTALTDAKVKELLKKYCVNSAKVALEPSALETK